MNAQPMIRRPQRRCGVARWTVCLLLAAVTVLADRDKDGDPIRLAGCKTCAVLVRNVAKEADPVLGLATAVNPCGNKIGLKLLLDGNVDVAILCQHPHRLSKRFPFVASVLDRLHAVAFARDSYCLMVHPDNPVERISFEDLAKIYRGDITNWKELGGDDLEIWAYRHNPELGSGLALFFQEKTIGLKGKFSTRVRLVESPRITGEYVARHKNAMGYASLSDVPPGVKQIAVGGERPTLDSVRTGSISCSVTYYLVTVDQPTAVVKRLADFYRSKAGREVICRYCILAEPEGEGRATGEVESGSGGTDKE